MFREKLKALLIHRLVGSNGYPPRNGWRLLWEILRPWLKNV